MNPTSHVYVATLPKVVPEERLTAPLTGLGRGPQSTAACVCHETNLIIIRIIILYLPQTIAELNYRARKCKPLVEKQLILGTRMKEIMHEVEAVDKQS